MMDETPGAAPATELIVVEGKSAASSVAQACDKVRQRVYAVQGKPPNADKATRAKVLSNPACQGLFAALGYAGGGAPCDDPDEDAPCSDPDDGARGRDPNDVARRRATSRQYTSVVILTDADPDGVHCRVLVLRLLAKYCRGLFGQTDVSYVRAPQYRLSLASEGQSGPRAHYADDAPAMMQMRERLAGDGAGAVSVTHFRGIAQMSQEEIRELLLNPRSPRRVRLSLEHGDGPQ